jgi:hypothetical protein
MPVTVKYPPITKDDILRGSEFHDNSARNSTGCVRWRRNGATKTWVTRPAEFRIPVKYGLYGHGYITETNASEYHTAKNCPHKGA